ncbi:DNA cytosine methyltransferase [Methylorubrum thiocyanatum]
MLTPSETRAREARAYYNEIDPYAAEWLRNLIAAGHITPGDVDERSIVDVRPSDLDGYERCHFFAGIGVWDYALNLAGWPAGRPVWTGSCPCQPFSTAGRQAGLADERHLWPAWFELIRECGPDAVLGEQVEAAVRLGWLDAVFSDLEGQGYACGAVVLGAHSVGAPHIRQRLWFVADAGRERCDGQPARLWRTGQGGWFAPDNAEAAGRREAVVVADAPGEQRAWALQEPRGRPSPSGEGVPPRRCGDAGGLGDPEVVGRHGRGGQNPPRHGQAAVGAADANVAGIYANLEWLPCRDGKARPTQPGLQPLAHGAPARVGRLRAYGNAINAEAAAAFIGAVIDTLSPTPTPGGLAEGER